MTSRRSFVSQSAALAALPFISTRVTRALAAASRPKLGFALCGLGSLSTHQIAPALQKTVNCRLAGIITGTPAKAVRWKAQYGIPDKNIYHYETMHRMADNPDIDVVYVVTPNAIHLDNALAAAKAGKHVYCEKPMEISVARCQQMIDAVKAAGRVLGVGYRLHFEPNNLECVRIARSREFGALKLIDAHFGFPIQPGMWRLNRSLAGGGPLMDVGIYCVQAARTLTGEEPVAVTATLTRGDERFAEVEESITWQTKFPGGALAHCSSSYGAAPAAYFRALAERGWFALDPAFTYDGIRGTRSDGRPIDHPDIDQFAAEMDDFADCISNGKPTRVPGEEGLRDVQIMMAIYEAARSGKSVDL
ncbi:MAG TPA: Gfo/Idh/MocA family oxidoreductase [Steroidobacteraceae bacterium]|nr:Gfo/Idh/MocA family oxidoreductase [Steroidobacteraceae bacterium]